MRITKKLAIIVASAGLTIGIGLSGTLAAHAQLFTYTGSSTAPSSSVIDASSTTTSTTSTDVNSSTMTPTATIAPTVTAPAIVPTGPVGSYLQIDGLSVVSVSTTTLTGGPVMIWAADPAYPTMTSAGTVVPAATTAVVCTQFATDSSSMGTSTACPVPPVASAAATSSSSSGTDYAPYTINVNAATQLLLDDRAPATLSSILPGDTINVYGYYTNDGGMDAEIVRDISTPGTVAIGGGGSGGSTGTAGTTTVSSTAALQAELNQLEALVLQLETELGVNVTTTVALPPITTSCPMIPAGATSTAGCPPTSSTTPITSSTIYE